MCQNYYVIKKPSNSKMFNGFKYRIMKLQNYYLRNRIPV